MLPDQTLVKVDTIIVNHQNVATPLANTKIVVLMFVEHLNVAVKLGVLGDLGVQHIVTHHLHLVTQEKYIRGVDL